MLFRQNLHEKSMKNVYKCNINLEQSSSVSFQKPFSDSLESSFRCDNDSLLVIRSWLVHVDLTDLSYSLERI